MYGSTQGSNMEEYSRHFKIFMAHVRSTTGGYIFSLFVSPDWGGTPSTSQNISTGPMSFLWGTPCPSHNTSTGPMSFPGGTPVPGGGTPVLAEGGTTIPGGYPSPGQRYPSMVRSGWRTPWPGQDGEPPSSTGYAWTGYTAGSTPLVHNIRGISK